MLGVALKVHIQINPYIFFNFVMCCKTHSNAANQRIQLLHMVTQILCWFNNNKKLLRHRTQSDHISKQWPHRFHTSYALAIHPPENILHPPTKQRLDAEKCTPLARPIPMQMLRPNGAKRWRNCAHLRAPLIFMRTGAHEAIGVRYARARYHFSYLPLTRGLGRPAKHCFVMRT